MADIKTKPTDADVLEFINSFADTEQKRKDSFELIKIMQDFTGCEPKMWGSSIIGFDQYHYKSEKSKQEGDWPILGFSPRKAAISLYVYSEQGKELLNDLGKFKMGKGCIYVKKLSDIDTAVLVKLMNETVTFIKAKYGNH